MKERGTFRENWHPQSKQECAQVREQLEIVLASPQFCNSKRYPALLSYIVEHALNGNTDSLKERSLGIEVFGRTPTYDTNSDTVVRYSAGEVRKRLALYYSDHGKDAAIRISLPAGSYVPEFELRIEEQEPGSTDSADPAQHAGEGAHGQAAADGAHALGRVALADSHGQEKAEYAHPVHAAGDEAESGSARRTVLWVLLLVSLLGAGTLGWWLHQIQEHPYDSAREFWTPLLHEQHTVMLCTGSVIFQSNAYSGVHTAGREADYPFVSFQNASAIVRVSQQIERDEGETVLLPAATTSLNQLGQHPLALLGGYNNLWTLRLVEPLRYHFVPATENYTIPEQNPSIVDRQQPAQHWQRDVSLPYSSADDYALVARYRSVDTDSWVVVIAGLGRNGTEAGAIFTTSSHYLDQLRERLGHSLDKGNIEVVLKVNVIDGKTGVPVIQAVHTW